MLEGVVIKSTGSWYEVRLQDGNIISARVVGKLRLEDLKTTNPVTVGDKVRVSSQDGSDYVINEVFLRKNYVVRQSPRKKHNVHLIASNVDQALLIVTIVSPKVKVGFIDRFLMMTEPYDIPVIICFNKVDLHSNQDEEYFDRLSKLYSGIGYKILEVSSINGTGLPQLKDLLKDKVTLIAGQSGVGKSTMVNSIEPDLELKVGEISDYSGKGQHTTTFAEMHQLSFGGEIIDTPGIKTLAFNHFEIQDIAHNFKEFFEVSSSCKFNDCSHRNEPKCAVKEAISNGTISEIRYANYLAIVDEVENQNYWEVHDDI